MKYTIDERDGQFAIFEATDSGQAIGEPLGSFPTMAEAEAAVSGLIGMENGVVVSALNPEHAATAMIAFYPDRPTAETLAAIASNLPGLTPESELIPVDEIHLTMAFLGDVSSQPATQEQVVAALTAFAATHAPIEGVISGVGRFNVDDPDKPTPFYVSFDARKLPEIRAALVDALAGAGVRVEDTHGYTPHITISYIPAALPTPTINVPPIKVLFTEFRLVWANLPTAFPLAGEVIAAAPDEPVDSNTLKAISETDEELRVGNYIVLFDLRDMEGVASDNVNPDGSAGEYFTKNTQFDSPYTAIGRLPIDWEHGQDPDKDHPDPRAKAPGRHDVFGYVDWSTAKPDDKGLWVERVLNRRAAYMKYIEPLIEARMLGNSSECIPGKGKKTANGEIVEYPLYRDTFTIKPMEPYMMTENVISALKALPPSVLPSSLKSILGESVPVTEPPTSGADTERKPVMDDSARSTPDSEGTSSTQKTTGATPMSTLIDSIKTLVPDLTDDQAQKIGTVITLAMANPQEVLGEDISPELAEEMMAMEDDQIPEGKALKNLVRAAARVVGIKAAWVGQRPGAATSPAKPSTSKAVTRPPYSFAPAQPVEDEAMQGRKAVERIYVMRFGDEDAAMKAVLGDVIGADYQQRVWDQNIAFMKYLRGGTGFLEPAEAKALRTQYFPFADIRQMLTQGFTIDGIKSVMQEAQGVLGGYAVPPNVQAEISKRLPGLTAVRGGGARVVTLFNSNSVEITQYTGGDDRFVGALRGAWGSETQVPGEKNATVGLITVSADLYTYKVPMSVSLAEDAANLIETVQQDIVDTLAQDEDYADLIGDGVGKPLGILPGGANANNLKEVVSGAAAALTTAGIKNLKRGVASQYRARGVWVANSDTYAAIENLTVSGTGSDFAFPDLSETNQLLNRKAYESESMPDVAAGAFPAFFGDMSGYTIVERAGLTIERFHDSGTGINKIEFHVRKRVGGRIEQPWKFAVQKVAAS